MNITYISKHGKNKKVSQDCIRVNDQIINNYAGVIETDLRCICIADGVGGVAGGYEASSFILNNFELDGNYENEETIRAHMYKLNEALIEYANSLDDKSTMATTFTGLIVKGHKVWLIHAGNTRLYSIRNNQIKQITKDQTIYQAMVIDGSIEVDKTFDKNVLYCCFGTGNKDYINSIQIEELKLENAPDYLLFTSDGIHDHVNDEDMQEILSKNLDDRNKLLELIECAESNGSTDDCTAVIARRKDI